MNSDDPSNNFAQGRNNGSAGPCDLAGAAMLACTPVGADHSNDRGAEAERHWMQDVFETRALCVADGRFTSQLSSDSHHDREIGDGAQAR